MPLNWHRAEASATNRSALKTLPTRVGGTRRCLSVYTGCRRLVSMIIHLSRVKFALRSRSVLVFPNCDAGFKGSAWHGRIDNFIQRDAALNKALKKPRGSSASDRYLIDAPEDRTDSADGPFSRADYPAGLQFELSIVVAQAHLDRTSGIVGRLIHAVAQAGNADGAAFRGAFDIESTHVESFPLIQLAPATIDPAQQTAVLHVAFRTMLRLGGGDHLDAAKIAMQQSMQAVPSLSALTESLTRRAAAFAICEDSAFAAGLEDLNGRLHDVSSIRVHRPRVTPFDVKRLSGNANITLPIGGLLGEVSYTGPSKLLADLYPLFKLGEWIRIGQKTGLGLGRIRVSIAPGQTLQSDSRAPFATSYNERQKSSPIS